MTDWNRKMEWINCMCGKSVVLARTMYVSFVDQLRFLECSMIMCFFITAHNEKRFSRAIFWIHYKRSTRTDEGKKVPPPSLNQKMLNNRRRRERERERQGKVPKKLKSMHMKNVLRLKWVVGILLLAQFIVQWLNLMYGQRICQAKRISSVIQLLE